MRWPRIEKEPHPVLPRMGWSVHFAERIWWFETHSQARAHAVSCVRFPGKFV